METGDEVIAVRTIGGLARSEVPKGSRGVVTAAGWSQPLRVSFTVKGLLKDKQVELTVEKHEIRRA